LQQQRKKELISSIDQQTDSIDRFVRIPHSGSNSGSETATAKQQLQKIEKP